MILEKDESEVIQFVDRAFEYFVTYTNRCNVPDRAFFLWVDCAVYMSANSQATVNEPVVSKVDCGDTSVSYKVDTTDVLGNLNKRLDRYKVIKGR